MSTSQARCKNCGRPLSEDEYQNFFSFCYDCFKDYKNSKMRKGSAIRIIGIIGLVLVSMVLLMILLPTLGDSYGSVIPLRMTALIIGSIIAILIPILLIIFGIQLERKWKLMIKAKPIEPQKVITIPAPNTSSAQKKFCPECGNKLSDQHQKFCINCGAEIQNI